MDRIPARFVTVLVVLLASFAHATYFRVDDRSLNVSQKISLLTWQKFNDEPESSPIKYNRNKHFGSWLVAPNENNCQNTRAKVLIRDSLAPTTFTNSNECVVDSGEWNDPYTGKTFTSARDIQIDHVVALKNAFVSGAWKWDAHKRCVYANFLGNDLHLRAVSGTENMKKLDYGPEKYLPPNKAYTCQYLRHWLFIKTVWQLTLNSAEASAISQSLKSSGCDRNEFVVATSEIAGQRQEILNEEPLCDVLASQLYP